MRPWTPRLSLVLLLAAALPGCRHDLAEQRDAQPDAVARDLGADGPASDHGPRDVGLAGDGKAGDSSSTDADPTSDGRAVDTRTPTADSTPRQDSRACGPVKVISYPITSTCKEAVVAGDVDCGSNAARSSFPGTGSWSASCSQGTTAGNLRCTVGLPVRRSTPVSFTSVVGKAHCGADRLIGGGCDCAGADLIRSLPTGGDTEWTCQCSQAAISPALHAAYALCLPQAVASCLNFRFVSGPGTNSRATATCGNQVALGGGCAAVGGVINASFGTANGWSCFALPVLTPYAWVACIDP